MGAASSLPSTRASRWGDMAAEQPDTVAEAGRVAQAYLGPIAMVITAIATSVAAWVRRLSKRIEDNHHAAALANEALNIRLAEAEREVAVLQTQHQQCERERTEVAAAIRELRAESHNQHSRVRTGIGKLGAQIAGLTAAFEQSQRQHE